MPLHPLLASWHHLHHCHPNTPETLQPMIPLSPLHPIPPLQSPDTPTLPAGSNAPYTLLLPPWHHLHHCHPNAPETPTPNDTPETHCPWAPYTPWHPYTPCWPMIPPIPEQKSSCQEWYYCRWAWHVSNLWGRLLFCHMHIMCYCLQFSIDHLHVSLVIMIELGSIFQIPLCIICVTEMDKPESPSYSAWNDEYIVHEQITQADLI